jgi:hypothetical protein
MKPSEEADVIVEHAFESGDNLRTAVKVGLAFTTIRERIEKEFIEQLISTLKCQLGEWQRQEWDVKDYWWSEKCITAYKPKRWGDNARIGLSYLSDGPSGLYFYIWRSPTGTKSVGAALKQTLDGKYPGGRSGAENPWWKTVEQPPYGDWTSEEALMSLWKKDEAVKYYVERLLIICQLASPLVDKICEK